MWIIDTLREFLRENYKQLIVIILILGYVLIETYEFVTPGSTYHTISLITIIAAFVYLILSIFNPFVKQQILMFVFVVACLVPVVIIILLEELTGMHLFTSVMLFGPLMFLVKKKSRKQNKNLVIGYYVIWLGLIVINYMLLD
jgi:hypothetical protein